MIVRQAAVSDADDMDILLNHIIKAGGTIAHQRPFDADRMAGPSLSALSHQMRPSARITRLVFATIVVWGSRSMAGWHRFPFAMATALTAPRSVWTSHKT